MNLRARRSRVPLVFDDARLRASIRSAIASVLTSESLSGYIADLLDSAKRDPGASRRQHGAERLAPRMSRLAASLEAILDVALLEAVCLDDEHLDAIRVFFLEPRDNYSLDELAALWRVRRGGVLDVYHDRIAQWEASGGAVENLRIEWSDAIGTTIAFNLLRPYEIELALGPDLARARAERWRTVPVLIRIPRFIADAFALDPALPHGLALAGRVEQILLEFFTTEELTGDIAGEGAQR